MQQWSGVGVNGKFLPHSFLFSQTFNNTSSNRKPSFINGTEPWADCTIISLLNTHSCFAVMVSEVLNQNAGYTFHTFGPLVFQLDPVSGPVEGGTLVTISGSNLGQRAEDIQNSVTVAGVPCNVIHSRYEVSSRQVIGPPEHKLLVISTFFPYFVLCLHLVG